ncbi:GmrSD restriction endonuclease domain-containing protein [Xylanimonas cellulosilytica]|uniref:GmrSD restriction endonuclease domain-containing protein n=1 Tax=Xylanimonas cellulosilytica TaxID=186189 RepID=UPI00019C06DA|nr:DUF1524 domain-containing protein [Xylanimonas cellulosilytica]
MNAAPAARCRTSPWAVMGRLAVALSLLATGVSCAPAITPDGAASSSASSHLAVTDDRSPTTQPTPQPTSSRAGAAEAEPPAPEASEPAVEAPASEVAADADAARPAEDEPAGTEAASGTALAAVAELTIKGRAPKTGYTRDQFGPAWADVDHNGCDTRNDILNRDLTGVVTRDGTHGCVVLTGTFADPYSGQTIAFQRGQTTSSLVQIDHVVALSDAWQKGAQQWDAETRRQFANDPLNLLAADGSLNAQKGDGDTATWLPPHKAFRCAYVARQVAVKRAYGLWVTQAEHDAMAGVLGACPGEPLPTGGPVTVPPAAAEDVVQELAPAQQPAAPELPTDVYFANCTEARAAGAAPLRLGDPGYRPVMDRDGDGVACE